MKRYKSTTILGGGPPGKIVQCQSFENLKRFSRNHNHFEPAIFITQEFVYCLGLNVPIEKLLHVAFFKRQPYYLFISILF